MSTRLAAEQERARQAHDRLAEATTGHAAEIELTAARPNSASPPPRPNATPPSRPLKPHAMPR